MKKTVGIIIGFLAAILVVFGLYYVAAHNSIISLEENVESASAEIDVQLKRRADLIPNLVNTVKGYTDHEEKTIANILEARSKMVGAGSLEEKDAASQKLTSELKNLYVIVENYPELKADTSFVALQDELAGTENRLATARKDYNDAVKNYNTKIKTLPSSIIAGMMGSEEKAYLETKDEDKEVPTVNF